MKNFVKYLSVYLTVVMCLIGCVSFAVPSFAAEHIAVELPFNEIIADYYYDVGFDSISRKGVNAYVSSNVDMNAAELLLSLEDGDYFVSGTMLPGESGQSAAMEVSLVYFITEDGVITGVFKQEFYGFGEVFTVDNSLGFPALIVQSHSAYATVYRVVEDPEPEGLYYEAYDMFRGFFYGLDIDLTTEQNMVLTILATAAVLFVVVMPFVAVFFLVKLICGR